MNSTLHCSGNDLSETLARLRRDGYKPWALNTRVEGNAGYEIEFFAGEADSTSAGHVKPREATEHERSQTVAVAVVDGEHAGISLPESHVAATVPVKKTELCLASGNSFGGREPSDGELSEVPGCKTSGVTIAANPTIGNRGAVIDGASPLDTALARLERVVKQRSTRPSRFKPMKEARMPHAND